MSTKGVTSDQKGKLKGQDRTNEYSATGRPSQQLSD